MTICTSKIRSLADIRQIYVQKQPFLRALKILKSGFWLIFFSIFTKTEPESALRLGFRQTFFSGILKRFGASEKNGVDFQKNIFHAYFGCKSAIARDRDFGEKTAFYEVLRANYSHGSELWLQSVLTTQKYEKTPFQRCAQI